MTFSFPLPKFFSIFFRRAPKVVHVSAASLLDIPDHRCFRRRGDTRLPDLKMTNEEYLKLPSVTDPEMTDNFLASRAIGFRFVAEDGHVCEKYMMPSYWRHYNPLLVVPTRD